MCTLYVRKDEVEIIVRGQSIHVVVSEMLGAFLYPRSKEWTVSCEGLDLAGQGIDAVAARASLQEAIKLFLEDQYAEGGEAALDRVLTPFFWKRSTISTAEALDRLSASGGSSVNEALERLRRIVAAEADRWEDMLRREGFAIPELDEGGQSVVTDLHALEERIRRRLLGNS